MACFGQVWAISDRVWVVDVDAGIVDGACMLGVFAILQGASLYSSLNDNQRADEWKRVRQRNSLKEKGEGRRQRQHERAKQIIGRGRGLDRNKERFKGRREGGGEREGGGGGDRHTDRHTDRQPENKTETK